MSGTIALSSCYFITRAYAAQKKITLPRDICVYGENATPDKVNQVMKLFGIVQQYERSKKPSSLPSFRKAWDKYQEYAWANKIWLQVATIVDPETSYDYYGVKIPTHLSVSILPKNRDEPLLRKVLKLYASIFEDGISLQEKQKALDAYTAYMQLHSNEVRLRVLTESEALLHNAN